jgi:hypothetical protein
MFTVMHDKDGIQTFHKAIRVQRIGPHASIGPECVHLLADPDHKESGVSVAALYGGVVYVMNEKGATVGHYALPSDNRETKTSNTTLKSTA